jgi:hypothetical protein
MVEGLRALVSESERGELRFSPSRRSVILHAARLSSTARLSSEKGEPTGLRFWLEAPSKIPAFATLLAAFLIVGFAYFRTSIPVEDLSARPALPSGPSDLRVSQNGNEVVLEWSDGRKDAYLVRQATSARKVYSSPGVEVRGNRYVDRSPSDSAVVYYLVE